MLNKIILDDEQYHLLAGVPQGDDIVAEEPV